MQSIRLAASVAMALLLLAMVAILVGPSFAMPAGSGTAGLGRGALPQFCVVAAAVLALAVVIRDVLSKRRTGAITGAAEIGETTDPRRVVGIGLAALVMLAGFLLGWQWLGFLPATMAFVAATGLMLLPRAHWKARSLLPLLATSVLFSLGVWALFVYVLQVPLR
jgi:hypothetical protein